MVSMKPSNQFICMHDRFFETRPSPSLAPEGPILSAHLKTVGFRTLMLAREGINDARIVHQDYTDNETHRILVR